MKVLQINAVCGTGSTGRIVANLARMLEQRGHECLIAYGRGQAPDDVFAFKFAKTSSILFHGLMTRLTDRHGQYSRHDTRALIKKIQEYQPDIIHLHNIHGYYLNYKLLFDFLKQYDKPVIWTLHDCWSFTGHCSHYTSAICTKWHKGCYQCPLKRAYPGSFLVDRSKNNYIEKKNLFTSLSNLHLVVPSNWLKEQVRLSLFGDQYPCNCIPNGIETDRFVKRNSKLRKQYDFEEKTMILGVANVWTKQKGFDDFVKLSEILETHYQLVMIGVDEKQIKQLKNRQNILAIPRIQNIDELIEWYSSADIYFNSSIEETMGMTTGEAICCETPVVVYDSTAVPESVGRDCGIVVPPGNIAGVKAAIEEICGDRQRYIKGCKAYRNEFREEKANEAYYRIYEQQNR